MGASGSQYARLSPTLPTTAVPSDDQGRDERARGRVRDGGLTGRGRDRLDGVVGRRHRVGEAPLGRGEDEAAVVPTPWGSGVREHVPGRT